MKLLPVAMLGSIAFCSILARAATSGDDIISGGTGNDLIFLLEGNDEGSGLGGNDTLFGDAGSDTLFGGAGKDYLIGGSLGAYGDTAGNILIGGGDDDFLIGGAFGDDYHYDLGDGFDVIREFEQSGATTDRIIFGAGIDSTSIAFTRSRADLFVDYLGTDILRIESWFAGDGFRIEEFHFDDTSVILGSSLLFDGVTWTGTAAVDTYTAPTADAYRMEGLGGGDTLSGGANGDVILGGDGNDTINGNGGDDGIYGQAGNDNLRGNDGSDALFGGDGADTLLGHAGDDLLVGGAGNDSLQGSIGNDVYLWEIGDGDDTVTDATSEYTTGILNTLQFGPGITPDRVTMTPSGSNLKFVVNDAAGQPIGSTEITSWYTLVTTGKYHRQFWKIAFADGIEWIGATMGTPAADILTGDTGPDIFRGAAGNDTLTGNGGDDQLYGEAGADTLNGGSGNDLLVGGPDNDSLNGSIGNDTYLWELGDGNDTITDATSEYVAGTLNILKFGPGITPDRITMTVSGSSLKFVVNDASGLPIGSADISSWYTQVTTGIYHRQFWKIVFDDGTEWLGAMLATPGADIITGGSGPDVIHGAAGNDTLSGGAGDDTLYGDPGNDLLHGGTGNDDFIWNLGDGDDTIQGAILDYAVGNTKRIVFGPGISPSDVTMVANSPELKFVVNNSSGQPIGSVKMIVWYSTVSGATHRYRDCFRIVFADSTEWVGKTMATPGIDILTGGTGPDILHGAGGGDTLTGADGDDQLYGEADNDTLNGDNGDDELYGDGGNDTLNGGNGNDLLEGGDGGDNLYGNAGADILSGGTGNDNLYGSTGNDTYHWELGGGDDVLEDVTSEYTAGTMNTLQFGPGVLPAQVQLETYTDGLKFVVYDEAGGRIGSVSVKYWYVKASGTIYHRDFWKIVFDNGTEWLGVTLPTPGSETFTGGSGADTLYGGRGNDTINGGDGDDTLYGGDDEDTLRGDAGNDVLIGGPGNDNLYGGTGDDDFIWNLSDGNDSIQGTSSEFALGSTKRIIFGPGILPSDLSMEVTSPLGLKFVVNNSHGEPIGYLFIPSWYSTVSGSHRYRDCFKIVFENGTEWIGSTMATPGPDILFGGSGADILYGGEGIDSLTGNDGDDQLYGGIGTDTLTGNDGDDQLYGGADNDTLNGGNGNDQLNGEDGADTLNGDAGDDILFGGLGNDILAGGAGNDQYLWALGDGNDVITDLYTELNASNRLVLSGIPDVTWLDLQRDGTYALKVNVPALNGFAASAITINDWIRTSGGVPHLKSWLLDIDGIGAFRFANVPTTSADTATGTTGDDLMLGLVGNDNLQGGDGNDLLYGGDGADVLDGGTGDDRLVAGLGDDSLTGGDGNDSYYINAGDGTDTITESASTTGNTDKLIFGPGIEANEIIVERNGNDLILRSKTTVNEITLKDWFSTAERFHAVESIEFFDGATWEIPFVETRVGDGAGSDNGEGDLGPHELIDEEDLNDSLDNHVPVISSMQVLTPLR